MPVIRLQDVPEVAVVGLDSASLVMKKAVGSRKRDPRFTMPISTESLSITHIKHWGRHRRITCVESDRFMFVVHGEAIVQVGKEPATLVAAGDFVIIPKGTPYEFSGDFTYLVMNAPAFRDGSDVRDDSYDGPPVRPGKSRPRTPSRPRRA
jgi:mannose-6-phosphate isomerase class I